MNNIFKFFDKIIEADSLNSNTRNQHQIISSDEDIIKLLNGEYSEAWSLFKNSVFIYRGARKYLNNNEYAVEIIPGIRISKDKIPNIYTILLSDILDSWKDFPKRNRSHICSLSLDTAEEFGEQLYYIFPRNGTEIGICPTSDIWNSFSSIYKNDGANVLTMMILFIFNIVLNDVQKGFQIEEMFKNAISTIKLFNDFDQVFDDSNEEQRKAFIDKFYAKYAHSMMLDYIKFVEDKNNNKSDIMKFLETYMFNPKNFKHTQLLNMESFSNKDKEVWFEGPALYVPATMDIIDWLIDNV